MVSLNRRTLLAAAGTVAALGAARKPLAAGSLADLAALRPARKDEAVPEVRFTAADGSGRTLAGYAGQGVVLNLWATWCPPCVAEMPALDRAQAALAGEGVRVLAVSSDRDGRAKVEPFYRERGIRHLGLWLDPRGAAQRALGARGRAGTGGRPPWPRPRRARRRRGAVWPFAGRPGRANSAVPRSRETSR